MLVRSNDTLRPDGFQPRPIITVILGPGENPSPVDYINEAEKALLRRGTGRNARVAAREAIHLIQLATMTAQQTRNWGCSLRNVRRKFAKVKIATRAQQSMCDGGFEPPELALLAIGLIEAMQTLAAA